MKYDRILIRYGELSLKKSNRHLFTKKVMDHIKRVLKNIPELTYQSNGLRFYIILNGVEVETVIPYLKKIPGIYSFSPVYKCMSVLEEINELALNVVKTHHNTMNTMKVETNRGDKQFPLTSQEISIEVSRHLFRNIPALKADVHQPEFTLSLDVRIEGTFIFSETIPGLGGFPSGILGKGLLLISGGIDSVVSGYQAIKRGIELDAIHYASPPYTSDLSLQKVVDLLQVLCEYSSTTRINLYVVPFTPLQQAIYDNVREDYGITIMRRMMYRIAEKMAEKYNCQCLITGESIGQVASQTLESLGVINEVTSIPVIRPLATYDKQDIIDVAKKINSFDISIRPYEDCCTVFVPRHPQTKPSLKSSIKEERKINFEELIETAIQETKRITLDSHNPYSVIQVEKIF